MGRQPAVIIALALACAAVASGCPAPADRVFCEPGIACATASADACAAGLEATRHGRAAFASGTCAPKDDATCAAATLTCRLWGQCHAPTATASSTSATCNATDDRDFQASRDPACAVGTCVALRTPAGDDCAHARVCSLEGRCTAQDGVCVATTPEACKASDLCREIGWCAPRGTQCRPASAADCEQADTCKAYGDCAFSNGKCVECNRSPVCRSDGLCGRVANHCAAIDPRQCQQSIACQRDHRCRAFGGACVE